MAFKTNQICELFQIDKSTLTRWKKLGARVAYEAWDQWNGPAFLEWWASNIYEGPSSVSDTGDIKVEKLRYIKLKTDLLEIEKKEKKGQLVDADAVNRDSFLLLRTARDAFQGIPVRLAPLLAAEKDSFKCNRMLLEEINFVLTNLANGIKKNFGEEAEVSQEGEENNEQK